MAWLTYARQNVRREAVRWLDTAREPAVVRRAVSVASVVGPILIAINHGPAILRGDLSVQRVLQMLLTVFVPYAVSTYSSVGAIHERQRHSVAAGRSSGTDA